jgi:hypothetical protein
LTSAAIGEVLNRVCDVVIWLMSSKCDFTPSILPNIIRCTLSAISMRIFVCGHELGLGFVLARRLVAGGHRVNILTSFEDLIPNLTKNGLNPVRAVDSVVVEMSVSRENYVDPKGRKLIQEPLWVKAC